MILKNNNWCREITLQKPSLKYKPIYKLQHSIHPHFAYLELKRHQETMIRTELASRDLYIIHNSYNASLHNK